MSPHLPTIADRTVRRQRRPGSRLFPATLVAALAVGVFGAPTPAFAAAGDPFDHTNASVFLAQAPDNGGETLYQHVQGAGSVTFDKVNVEPTTAYNGMGFRVRDGYIYGFNGVTLLRIGQGGVVTTMGAVGIPAGEGIYTGAFGEGAYSDVLFAQGSSTTVYAINFANWNGSTASLPQAVALTTNPAIPNCADAFFTQGYLWEACDAVVWRIPPTGGAAKSFAVPFLAGGGFGAQWVYGNGNAGVSNNASGLVIQFSIANGGSDNPTFTLVSTMTGPSASGNDGTSIPGADTDMSLTKTTNSTYVPGGTVAYTLTVTNNSDHASSGHTLTDTIPAGLSVDVDELPTGCVYTASSRLLTCTGGRLAAGASAQTVLRLRASESGTSCIDNTAAVLGNELDTATANNSATVRTCRAAGLKVAASVGPDTVDQAGAEVTYTFQVANNGDTPINNISVDVESFTGTGTLGQPVCQKTSLAIDEATTCTVTYQVTQADIDSGEVDSLMIAAGGTADGRSVASPPASTVLAVDQSPDLTVAVTTPPLVATVVGEPVWFEVTLTNTGNVTLSGVGVDPGLTSGTGDPVTVGECRYPDGRTATSGQIALAPDQTATCRVSYLVTQADLDAGGELTYEPTVSATDPAGDPAPGQADPAQTSVIGVYDGQTEVPWNTPATVDVLGGVQNLPDGTVAVGVTAKPGDVSQDSWWALDPNTGAVVFTPPPTFSGTANGVVTIRYPNGDTDTQPVSVTVLPPDVSVQPDQGTVPETGSVKLRPQITAPTGSDVAVVGDPAQGTWTVLPDKSVSFTPKPGYLGHARATITVTAPDGTSATATLDVSVTSVPQVGDASAKTIAGQPVTLAPRLVVPDGSVVQVSGLPAQGAWVVNRDNTVTFTPADGFLGRATATILVTGPDGATDTAALSVDVTSAPFSGDAWGTVPAGSSTVLHPDLLVPPGATIRVTGDADQGEWTLNPDRSIRFTPAPGFTGQATGTLTITDSDGLAATSTLTVDVLAPVDALLPAVAGVWASVLQNTPITLSPQLTLPTGSTVAVNGDPAQGTWMVNPDKTVTFTPANGFAGRATATISVTGPDGTTVTAELRVEVDTPAPQVPSVVWPLVAPATDTGEQGKPVTLRPPMTVPADSTIRVDGDPAQGTWTVNEDHSITFTPAPGFTGRAAAVVTVTTPDGLTAAAELAASITPAADTDTDDPTDGPGGDDGQLASPTDETDSPGIGTGGAATGSGGLATGLAGVLVLAALGALVLRRMTGQES